MLSVRFTKGEACPKCEHKNSVYLEKGFPADRETPEEPDTYECLNCGEVWLREEWVNNQ